MEWKDRFTFVISKFGYTYSQFAQILGIQPSAVSHIASGRNKPRWDMIEKIAEEFPKLNMRWFLTGVGDPFSTISKEENKVDLPPTLLTQDVVTKESNTTTEIKKEQSSLALPIATIVLYEDGTSKYYPIS